MARCLGPRNVWFPELAYFRAPFGEVPVFGGVVFRDTLSSLVDTEIQSALWTHTHLAQGVASWSQFTSMRKALPQHAHKSASPEIQRLPALIRGLL